MALGDLAESITHLKNFFFFLPQDIEATSTLPDLARSSPTQLVSLK
jgi:hypothetical protein